MNLKKLDVLLEKLNSKDRFLLTTHERPDADGLGAEIGMAYLLADHMSKDVIVLNQDVPPNFYNTRKYAILNMHKDGNSIQDLEDRTVLILDANTKSRIGKVARYINPDDSNLLIVDHHDGEVPDFEKMFLYPDMGSCCEIVFQILELSGVVPPSHIAEALYRGIILDTGHFRYGKTTAKTHQIAAALLQQGVQPAVVSEEIQSRWSYHRLLARKTLYEHIEFTPCRRIGWFSISYKAMQQITTKDSSIYEDISTDIFEAKEFYVAILFAEREPNVIRASLRARFGINLLPVIHQFGGGGHGAACGVRLNMPLPTAIEKLVATLLNDKEIFANVKKRNPKKKL